MFQRLLSLQRSVLQITPYEKQPRHKKQSNSHVSSQGPVRYGRIRLYCGSQRLADDDDGDDDDDDDADDDDDDDDDADESVCYR